MTQLYPSTAANGVWVLPGSHKRGKADIRKMVAESGSDRIEGAVPMLCDAGDTIVTNRQLVHGSFANSSPDRRITLNEGFFPRKRVLNVTTRRLTGTVETYDQARIEARTRILQIAIDARRQRFPQETRLRLPPARRPRGREPVERGDPRRRAEELQPARHVHLHAASELAGDVALHRRSEQPHDLRPIQRDHRGHF